MFKVYKHFLQTNIFILKEELNNMEKNNNMETSLEWKKHDNFFTDLNKMLDQAAKMEALIYLDFKNIYPYYAQISSLITKTVPYIIKIKDKTRQMQKIRTAIYSKQLKTKIENNYSNDLLIKILDDLVNLHREIILNLADNELLPKVMIFEKQLGAVRNG